jgi:DNA-binding response OmpR family regulator
MPPSDVDPRKYQGKAFGRLLLIEDEMTLAGPVKRGLEEHGYVVDLAHDGVEGEDRALSNEYDMLLVDWRLPRMDGLTLIGRLRTQGYSQPILMLTARRAIDDKVAGLDTGADDYLTKPFSFEELLARIRALLRRGPAETHNLEGLQPVHLQLGGIAVDTSRRRVTVGQAPLQLRMKEYMLLELLLRYQGQVLSRSVIAERIWGSLYAVTDNAIDVTVSGLRQKLAAFGPTQTRVVLETVRGVGYSLDLDRDSDPDSDRLNWNR